MILNTLRPLLLPFLFFASSYRMRPYKGQQSLKEDKKRISDAISNSEHKLAARSQQKKLENHPLDLLKNPMDFLSSKHSITLIATAIALLCFHTFIRAAKKKRHPPLRGSIFHQVLYFNTVYDYHTDLATRFKTFRIFSPARSLIYTVDPAIVEYILGTNYANYGKGSCNYDNLKDLFGDGIFAVDGEKWRHQRKLASYAFSTRNLRDFSSGVFISNASRLALMISKASKSNQAMDIQDLFMRSTLDSIFKVGFGEELDTLSGLSKEGNSFSKAFDDSSDLILWRYVDIFWKIKRFLSIGSEAELKKNIRVIDDFVYKLIHRKTESMSQQQNGTIQKEDILSRFLVEKKKDPKNLKDKYLRDIILNFIIAGRDTTAVTLSWFFYMLCKHPSMQEKLARDIKEATKTNDSISIAEFSSRLTGALEKMQYLHAALTETLRLYPAVPEDPKVCFSDDILPGGFDIREGDMVCFLPYSMGRMKFLWGEDAEIFRPDRWLDENGVFQPENPFKFTAFQAGPRICLGKEFAYRQMKIFAAVLIHFFVFKLSDEKKDVTYKSTITLRIAQGLHLFACQRELVAHSNNTSM